jgi:hypothetical protein
VREVIILPILNALGYKQEDTVRSKTLEHPFLKVGSNKKNPVKLVPDCILKAENNFAWMLDAKAPNKNADSSEVAWPLAKQFRLPKPSFTRRD